MTIIIIFAIDTGKPVIHPRSNSSVITNAELRKIRGQLSKSTFNMSQTAVVKKSDLVHLRSRSIVKDKFTLKKE